MPWLLDSDAWIHYLKNPQSAVRARLEKQLPGDIRVCSVVKAELFYGARKYGQPERRLARVAERSPHTRRCPLTTRRRNTTHASDTSLRMRDE